MDAYGWPLRVRNSLDAERAGGMARPDEHDVSDPVRDQLHPAQDEGPHEDLAELAVGLHERQQVVAIQLDHFARPRPRDRTSLRRPESMVTSPVNCPGRWTATSVSVAPDGRTMLDLTCRDDEERHDLIPRLDEHLARLDLAHVSVRRDARDLRRRQRRKHLVDTCGQGQGDWGSGLRHGRCPFRGWDRHV